MLTKKNTAFDIDTKEPEVVEELKESFKPFEDAQILCVETKNGFHLCFDKSILGKRNKEFNALSFKKYQFEAKSRDGKTVIQDLCARMSGDLIVCPGTLQRGFPTKLVKF